MDAIIPLGLGVGGGVIAAIAAMMTKRFSTLQLGLIVLTVATAVIHLLYGIAGERLLLLNGVGYLALLAALLLPISEGYKRPLRFVLAGYTLVTIVAYLVTHPSVDLVGGVTKLIELGLLLVLALTMRQAKTAKGDAMANGK